MRRQKMSEVIRINEETCRIEDEGVRFFLLTGKKSANDRQRHEYEICQSNL